MIKLTNGLDKIGIHLKRKIFKEIHENLGGRIKIFIAGAAAINPEVSKGFRDLGFLAVQGYGLTECAPIVALNRDVYYKDDSAGMALTNTEMKIDNPKWRKYWRNNNQRGTCNAWILQKWKSY